MATLTKALTRARTEFDSLRPRRDKASDGWIGDRAHQLERSGHNPDDTAGSLPESEDGDRDPEVRALDVDKDLDGPSTPHVVMQGILDEIIRTPEDSRRLDYIIFNGRIAVRNEGWVWRRYYGTNQHGEHAHLSGNPAYDHDNSPWRSISGGEMQLDDKIGPGTGYDGRTVRDVLKDVALMREWLIAPEGTRGGNFVPAKGSPLAKLERLDDLETKLDAIKPTSTVEIENRIEVLETKIDQILEALTSKPSTGTTAKK